MKPQLNIEAVNNRPNNGQPGGCSVATCSLSSTPDTDSVKVNKGRGIWIVNAEYMAEMERQRDKAVLLAGELVAIIRVNAMRGTWAEATPEQVDEFLVPWIAKLRVAQGHSPENAKVELPPHG